MLLITKLRKNKSDVANICYKTKTLMGIIIEFKYYLGKIIIKNNF